MTFNKSALLAEVDVALSNEKNIRAFYAHLFKEAPEVKKYFKHDVSTVATDPYWLKQGTVVLEKLRKQVNASDDPAKFENRLASFFESHNKTHGVGYEPMKVVRRVVVGYLASIGAGPDKGWEEFFKLWKAACEKSHNIKV